MHVVHEGSLATEPMSEAEQATVREQLNRLLETHHFRNSKRYPVLLRFIVEETLAGRGEYLKERLIGVSVFERPADYDTASDPVVRVTIAEVRKRIAQYYHDEEHDAEIRIELLPGRYAPEFRVRSARAIVDEAAPKEVRAVPPVVEVPVPLPVPQEVGSRRPGRGRLGWGPAVAGLLLVCGVGIALMVWLRSSALDQLWAPVLADGRPVLFCIPTDADKKHGPLGEETAGDSGAGGARGPTFLAFETLGQNVVYSDMLATLAIANVMNGHHRDYRVRLNRATTLADLRQGPAVLVGGLDNQWTMRALSPLRFHFAGTDEERYWIEDANSPEKKAWGMDLKQQYGAVTRDYAIIARLHSEQTGEAEMVVAGIGMSGTAAAGEFLGDKQRVEELKARIGAGFKDRDFEAVLSTDVVNGIAGSPKILAVTVW